MKRNVFAYGTLIFPEVIKAVSGKRLVGEPAKLNSYKRRVLKDKIYPGVLKDEVSSVEGVLYKNLCPKTVLKLDDFEDGLYEKVELPVETADGKTELADVYVISKKDRHKLSFKPWSDNEFSKKHLKKYTSKCLTWSKTKRWEE